MCVGFRGYIYIDTVPAGSEAGRDWQVSCVRDRETERERERKRERLREGGRERVCVSVCRI